MNECEPSESEFFAACNGNKRYRLFGEFEYIAFRAALEEAERCASARKPYYWAETAGGVAKKRRRVSTTARCGVYTTPEGEVEVVYDRVRVSSRTVKCIYEGGEQAYRSWFRSCTRPRYWFPEREGDDE